MRTLQKSYTHLYFEEVWARFAHLWYAEEQTCLGEVSFGLLLGHALMLPARSVLASLPREEASGCSGVLLPPARPMSYIFVALWEVGRP